MTGRARTQFKRGKSGNPGGRKKLNPEVKKLAEENAPAAFQKILTLMRGRGKLAFAAAKEVLDRAYGRPAQAVQVSGDVDMKVWRMPEMAATTEEWLQKCAKTKG